MVIRGDHVERLLGHDFAIDNRGHWLDASHGDNGHFGMVDDGAADPVMFAMAANIAQRDGAALEVCQVNFSAAGLLR